MKYIESGEAQKIREDETGLAAPGGRIKDLDQHWKRLLIARQVSGLDELREFARGNKLPFKKNCFYDEAAVLVGKCVQPYHTTDSEVSDGMEFNEMIQQEYPSYSFSGITWATERKNREMAFTHLAYGNEASIDAQYWLSSLQRRREKSLLRPKDLG